MSIADLNNPESLQVQDALTKKCPLCHAKPGQKCSNTIKPGLPLPGGRLVHYARSER
jgi:hypothetical protein